MVGGGSRASWEHGSRAGDPAEYRAARLSAAEARDCRYQWKHRGRTRPQPYQPSGPHRPHAARGSPRRRGAAPRAAPRGPTLPGLRDLTARVLPGVRLAVGTQRRERLAVTAFVDEIAAAGILYSE